MGRLRWQGRCGRELKDARECRKSWMKKWFTDIPPVHEDDANESGVQKENMFGDKWKNELKKHFKNGLPDKVEEIIKEDERLRILPILRRYYGMWREG